MMRDAIQFDQLATNRFAEHLRLIVIDYDGLIIAGRTGRNVAASDVDVRTLRRNWWLMVG